MLTKARGNPLLPSVVTPLLKEQLEKVLYVSNSDGVANVTVCTQMTWPQVLEFLDFTFESTCITQHAYSPLSQSTAIDVMPVTCENVFVQILHLFVFVCIN